FKLGQRVSGFIIAAPVADLAPGGSLRDKSRAERAVQQMLKQEENWHRIAPADINISRQMAIDGKTSPVGSAHAGFLGLFLDWTMPAHKGTKYKPGVVIIGNGDGLSRIGNEEAMDSSYGQLFNIVWYIVQSNRVNMLTGQVDELVGHVNLDYYAPNTKEV